MKILLITSEEWNDYVFGNGVLTNWFTGYDAEFAQIEDFINNFRRME